MHFRVKVLMRLWRMPLLAMYGFTLIITLFNVVNPPAQGIPAKDLLIELLADQMLLYAVVLGASIMFSSDVDSGLLGYTLMSPIPKWLYTTLKTALIAISTLPAVVIPTLAIPGLHGVIWDLIYIHLFAVVVGAGISSLVPWRSVAALISISLAAVSISIYHAVQSELLARWVGSFSLLAPLIGDYLSPAVYILLLMLFMALREEARQMRP